MLQKKISNTDESEILKERWNLMVQCFLYANGICWGWGSICGIKLAEFKVIVSDIIKSRFKTEREVNASLHVHCI